MKFLFFCLLAALSLVSCRPTRDINFEMMSPASYSLPAQDASYLILNCSYLPDYIDDSSNIITLISPPEMFIMDSIITNLLFDGLFSILNDSPNTALRDAEYLEMRTTDTTGFLRPLSPSDASEICRENNVNHLISLEYYGVNQSLDYYYLTRDYNYRGVLEQKQKLLWRIYSEQGHVMDEYFPKDTLYWDQLEFDYYQAKNGIPLSYDLIGEGFRIAGESYGKRISPSWEDASRFIYEISTKTGYGRKNISDVVNDLKALSSSNNKTKSYMACFNLAVLAESQGDINDALNWIELALKNKQTIVALKYYTILKNRKLMLELLDKQTGKTQ